MRLLQLLLLLMAPDAEQFERASRHIAAAPKAPFTHRTSTYDNIRQRSVLTNEDCRHTMWIFIHADKTTWQSGLGKVNRMHPSVNTQCYMNVAGSLIKIVQKTTGVDWSRQTVGWRREVCTALFSHESSVGSREPCFHIWHAENFSVWHATVNSSAFASSSSTNLRYINVLNNNNNKLIMLIFHLFVNYVILSSATLTEYWHIICMCGDVRHRTMPYGKTSASTYVDVVCERGLKSISTTAALRCAFRAIVNDSERYVAMSRYIIM